VLIKIINPNTSRPMTEAIERSARAVASMDVVAVTTSMGPASIESHYDEALAVPGVLAEMANADGYVIACFGDPGLDAAREAIAAPVLGIAEAAFHAASFLATRFSVVTTLTRTCVIAERLVRRYGFEAQCGGVHGTDIPVLDLEHGGEPLLRKIEAAAASALSQDRSAAIVLGCAGMAPLCAQLGARLGVPVVDGVAAAVKFAEALASLGLGTSRRGDYATPPAKPYAGFASHLGW